MESRATHLPQRSLSRGLLSPILYLCVAAILSPFRTVLLFPSSFLKMALVLDDTLMTEV